MYFNLFHGRNRKSLYDMRSLLYVYSYGLYVIIKRFSAEMSIEQKIIFVFLFEIFFYSLHTQWVSNSNNMRMRNWIYERVQYNRNRAESFHQIYCYFIWIIQFYQDLAYLFYMKNNSWSIHFGKFFFQVIRISYNKHHIKSTFVSGTQFTHLKLTAIFGIFNQ